MPAAMLLDLDVLKTGTSLARLQGLSQLDAPLLTPDHSHAGLLQP